MSGAARQVRRAAPLALLTLLALALAAFAWREAERARATEAVLMRDYAAFVADKFVRVSASEYGEATGLHGITPPGHEGRAFPTLRRLAEALLAGRAVSLPAPESEIVRYYFLFDAATRRLSTGGPAPEPDELRRLREAVESFAPACGAGLHSFGRIRGAARRPGESDLAWSGLVQADASGAVTAVLGFRLDEAKAVERVLVPPINAPTDCECPTNLLPLSLASVKGARHAASFVISDAAGRVFHRSEPVYASAAVRRALAPETPFPGWSVEVAINPAVVRPLLPYGGRGTPWAALALLGGSVLGCALLALRAARRDAELIRLRQDFVSNVSHELKTPLARIRLFNELLMSERQGDPGKRSHYREVIDRECRRLGLLIDRVLDFSRQERGALRYRKAPLDLRPVVAEALESFRASQDRGQLRLEADLQPVPPVEGDAHALQQVVINLLDNAVKYSPEGGAVELRLDSDAGRVRLSVRDHGCGIPAGEHERIFREFYRVESGDAQRSAGSGLGLTLARRAVLAHAGRITVESELGKGSVFTVELPVAAAEVPQAALAART